jgi:hypothetical protein
MTPQPYLDYLDKEMTIMGILSAFAVAVAAGILVTVIGKESPIANQLWSSSESFILAGSTLCLMASGFFYKERSLLAEYYGKLSYIQTDPDDSSYRNELTVALNGAVSSSTWWPYCCGFTLLFAGFTEYLTGIFLFILPAHPPLFSGHPHLLRCILLGFIPCVAAVICIWETHSRFTRNKSIWTRIASWFNSK